MYIAIACITQRTFSCSVSCCYRRCDIARGFLLANAVTSETSESLQHSCGTSTVSVLACLERYDIGLSTKLETLGIAAITKQTSLLVKLVPHQIPLGASFNGLASCDEFVLDTLMLLALGSSYGFCVSSIKCNVLSSH